MEQADNKHTFRQKFAYQMSLSTKNRSRVGKGIIDDRFYVQKIIECKDRDQQAFYQYILSNRFQVLRQLYGESMYTSKIVTQTIVKSDPQTKKQKILLEIFTPFYRSNQSLSKYAAISSFSSTHPIDLREKCARIQKIVLKACALLMKQSNHQLYTFPTFFFDEISSQLLINSTSFVGMQLMMFNQQISQADFTQIFELLGSFTLKKQPQKRFSIQLKFRAIGMLILIMVLQKHIKIFDKREWQQLPGQTYFQKYQRCTGQSSAKFQNVLNFGMVKDRITSIDKHNQVHYYDFLRKIFINQEQLTWTDVINLIVPKIQSRSVNINIPFTSVQLAEQFYQLNIEKNTNQDPLELLGLKSHQMKLYFVSLLSDEDTPLEELLKYEDIDDYIFSPHNFNRQNMSIYKKILKMVADVMDKKYNQHYSAPFMGQMMDGQYFNPPVQAKLQNFQAFLQQLQKNFGADRSKYRNKRQVNWVPKAQGISKYLSVFK